MQVSGQSALVQWVTTEHYVAKGFTWIDIDSLVAVVEDQKTS